MALMISGFSVLPFLSAYLVSNVGVDEKHARAKLREHGGRVDRGQGFALARDRAGYQCYFRWGTRARQQQGRA